jgi:hypothetical protein
MESGRATTNEKTKLGKSNGLGSVLKRLIIGEGTVDWRVEVEVAGAWSFMSRRGSI